MTSTAGFFHTPFGSIIGVIFGIIFLFWGLRRLATKKLIVPHRNEGYSYYNGKKAVLWSIWVIIVGIVFLWLSIPYWWQL